MTDSSDEYDLVVIGGGINGTAIAADAAGRGLDVLLCEQNDLGSGTSSWSTKLIHGGLRYLEFYEFSMVRAALKERQILLSRAPHLIRPIPFVLPHEPHLRPKWMLRAGLWIYDHLSNQKNIPKTTSTNLHQSKYGEPLRDDLKYGFCYYDCQTDDCRLVILNAQSARENGATIVTRTQCSTAIRETNHWAITLQNKAGGASYNVKCKALINATGPWLNDVLDNTIQDNMTARVALIQGSHIVVNSLYQGEHAYILQNKDDRIIFTIPYKHDFTLIGTTDVAFEGKPNKISASQDEKEYLINLTNSYFKKKITLNDIVWDFSGVRALYNPNHEDPSKITREYHIEVDNSNNLPLISILGGKLTTHRRLAEDVMQHLLPIFPNLKPNWTANTPLPGGDLDGMSLVQFTQCCQQRYPWLPRNILDHYIYNYGSQLHLLLNNCTSLDDLGQHFGHTFYQVELDHLQQHEWAQSTEDLLWRRTKYGLVLTPEQQQHLKRHLNEK